MEPKFCFRSTPEGWQLCAILVEVQSVKSANHSLAEQEPQRGRHPFSFLRMMDITSPLRSTATNSNPCELALVSSCCMVEVFEVARSLYWYFGWFKLARSSSRMTMTS